MDPAGDGSEDSLGLYMIYGNGSPSTNTGDYTAVELGCKGIRIISTLVSVQQRHIIKI